jgi:imidazolonepropionase-like amidohydrolase
MLSFAALAAASLLVQDTTVVTAARVLDVAAGRMVRPATVVISGDRIVRLGGPAPAGARVIDLGDVTLLPGLIDLHTHLTTDLNAPGYFAEPVRMTPAPAGLRGARNALVTLRAGFTTVRDVVTLGFADVALARAIERGFVPGPRVYPSAHAIGITGGHCDVTGFAPGVAEQTPEAGVADGPDEVVRAVRHQIKYGAKVIKLCPTAGVLSFEGTVGAQQMTEEEMRAAVQEARRHGIPVAAHAHGAEGILAAIRGGVTSIDHGSMLTDEAIEFMKVRGTWLVPTTSLRDIELLDLPPAILAKRRSIAETAKASLRKAIRAGVKIALGTDAGVLPHGTNGREVAALMDRGMTAADALRAATVNAAELLG